MFGDDEWWKAHYGFPHHPKRPTFFDDLMEVAERVLNNPQVIDRLTAKRSITLKVRRNNRVYKVVVEDVTGSEEPPVHIEIEDENGKSVDISDKHSDYVE